jgi:hypothetical protein
VQAEEEKIALVAGARRKAALSKVKALEICTYPSQNG